ncbi:MAG TPA: response regulator, partial [Rhizomicrobium sp.]
AEQSAAALQACRTQMPDAVLVDLANIDGIEFLRALRREESTKKPMVVFATIENDAVQIGAALNAGADEYLLKPFDREAIQSKFSGIALAA